MTYKMDRYEAKLGAFNIPQPINKMWDIMHACVHNLQKVGFNYPLWIDFNELRREDTQETNKGA